MVTNNEIRFKKYHIPKTILSRYIAEQYRISGFEICDIVGRRIGTPDPDYLCILDLHPRTPEKDGKYIGRLWFNNPARKAVYNQYWVLEYYGNGNSKKLLFPIDTIVRLLEVSIETKRKGSKPKPELTESELEYAINQLFWS